MKTKPVIVFDLDGTLIETKKRNYQTYCSVIKKLGGTPLPETTYWDLRRSHQPLSIILEKSLLQIEEQTYVQPFMNLLETPQMLALDSLFPFTIPTLEKLSKTHELILVTLRKEKNLAKQQLDHFSLTSFFSDILIPDNSRETKESLLMNKMNTFSDKKIMIGDMEQDILTGQKLGFTTIAVTTGLRNNNFLASYKPTHILGSIVDIPSLLK